MKFLANLFGAQSAEAKTLDQFRTQAAAAKASAEAVASLFTSAGLDLDGLLAAGPDALKTHLETLNKKADLDTAQAKVKELEGKNATLTADLNSATFKFSVVTSALAPVGIAATTKPEEFAGIISAHVKKEAALELAKTGHKPVVEVPQKPEGKGAQIDPTLTGIARVQAAFAAQHAARK